ncbi:hypothetical protein SAMN05421766_104391 [Zobellia uliginosa]|uniref:Uncharacterized protein n=1 Tax=Zobellia uliginosa TaxID=143224 RepID=A0ABY1KW49_9FLAO|nr:hypothetical protein [Zobellia uliginosa]MDO6517684.1 hypothetical protein [Zobellia uliginosa]SIS85371.1 hypothetical protein SAMN05421766_104391 [Zobellia uliginosa]
MQIIKDIQLFFLAAIHKKYNGDYQGQAHYGENGNHDNAIAVIDER